jgi:hypothetical protein
VSSASVRRPDPRPQPLVAAFIHLFGHQRWLILMDASVFQSDQYREHALECLNEAHAAEDQEFKQVFHRLAMWWIILAHEAEGDGPYPHYHLGEARPLPPSVGGSDRHFPLGDQLSFVDTSLVRIQPTVAPSSPAPPSPIAIDSTRVIKALRRLGAITDLHIS